MSVSGTLPTWDDFGSCFFTASQAARRLAKKRRQNSKSNGVFLWSQWATKSDRPRPSAGKCPTSLHARDDVEKETTFANSPHVIASELFKNSVQNSVQTVFQKQSLEIDKLVKQ